MKTATVGIHNIHLSEDRICASDCRPGDFAGYYWMDADATDGEIIDAVCADFGATVDPTSAPRIYSERLSCYTILRGSDYFTVSIDRPQ